MPLPANWNVLALSFLTVFFIGFGVWVVSAGKRYREEYAQATTAWHVGGSQPIEVTLVADDKHSLACSNDQTFDGLHCGYRRNGAAANPSPDDPKVLQPYNTVNNELFLGAGLWLSPDLKDELPTRRFTVNCTYNIKGVARSVGIRFSENGTFSPVSKTVTVGTLTDCVLPR